MDDDDAWKEYPQHRWVFNKLEIALKFGYDAGPACVPITKSGDYIIRPIYNLYGMGLGAKIIHIDISQAKEMEEHALVPPGHFWCETFKGTHKSVDFERSAGYWKPFCTIVGESNEENLVRFKSWKKTWNTEYVLPRWMEDIDDVKNINLEMIDDKVIEVHLRTGNDIFHDKPIGYTLYPVWESDGVEPDFPNEHPERYDASGYLSDIRVGYSLTKPSK